VIETGNQSLRYSRFRAECVARLRYLRATDHHVIGVIRFHRDRGEHLACARGDGLDSRGEFSMGSRLNGEGNCGMPMASNDAEPVHRVRVVGFWMQRR
jgi:hypothetical protein